MRIRQMVANVIIVLLMPILLPLFLLSACVRDGYVRLFR